MKIRNGFVSNSSSSSFVCMVSGEVEGGWDMSLEDAGMYQCVNGHTFCERFILDKKVQASDIENDHEDDDEDYDSYDERYEVSSDRCPICTLTKITDEDILKYVIKKCNFEKSKIVDNIRTDYGDYKTFQEALKK